MTHRDWRDHNRTGNRGRRISGRLREHRRRQDRRLLSESLEPRQLMAGPDLIGVQPNEGALINGGEILNVSPREIVFRFDDATELDPTTLGGIRITRAGEDGVFESATATSDLGTAGAALVEFRAKATGALGNGIVVNFTSSSRAGSPLPLISVSNRTVSIDVNNNPANPTRIQSLISAIANHPTAGNLLEVISVSGSTQTPVGMTIPNGLSLTLAGANAAEATTDFGTGGDVSVRIVSQLSGVDGLGTQITIERRNFFGPANPLVVVTGKSILVQLNSFAGNPSTAQDFVNAINNNPDASALVNVLPQGGDLTTPIGAGTAAIPKVALTGVTDVVIEPGFVGLGDSPREVIFRFAEPLPDDVYQIDILGTGPSALLNTIGEPFGDGGNETRNFSINLGPKVVAVVPEPIRRNSAGQLVPQAGKIDVHFNDDTLNIADAQNPAFYRLIFTRDTVSNTDDYIAPGPIAVQYNPSTRIATLDYGRPLSRIIDPFNGQPIEGAARLRIGSSEGMPSVPVEVTIAADPNDTFDGATQLTIDSARPNSIRLGSEIFNPTPYGLNLPGPDVPGTRTIRADDPSRLARTVPLDYLRNGADVIDGTSVIQYDFVNSWLGDDPNQSGIAEDRTYFNIISEQQKDRVREVMTLFSEYLGISFIEVEGAPTSDASISIAVGDLYGGNEAALSGDGDLALVTRDRNGDGVADLVVLDFQDFDESIDDQFGGEFFRGAMFGVGQLLGYGYADDLPQPVSQSTSFIFTPGTDNEPAFPSVADIVHGQYLFRPDSTDIDLYRFSISRPGTLSIETLAERLSDPSLLDTALRLYRQQGDGRFVEIAQNDDYFSNDSLIELEVSSGTYIVGVSARGNTSYDPTIDDSGFGGLTEGQYELIATFDPSDTDVMTDTTNIPLDGDADGRPGGVFDFWFEPADPSETIYVDKEASVGGNGTVSRPFQEIDLAIAEAVRRGSDGITIRVVGNGGTDGRVETTEDNFSYQIGFANNGTALADGSSLNLPKGVRMVIDSSAILKLSRSRIGVGSVSPLIDVSNASLQVLGTPNIITATGQRALDVTGKVIPGSVIFTSVNDNTVGMGNMTPTFVTARPGDWGGIDFRGDLDVADETRRNREDEGVFLNHIQYADMKYGGGSVSIAGRQVVVSPIDMAITRATVINSLITNSADAAIAATPDTFEQTRFTTPEYQAAGRFTPDYDRVGPRIVGNTVIDNSINGLFIRVVTRTGDVLEKVNVSARFDDTDIPHVLTENLVINGTAGGAILQSSAPSSLLVRLTPTTTGNIPAGTYTYRLTNVDNLGLESASSQPTVTTVLSSTGGVVLNQLPPTGVNNRFVSRRLYRAEVDSLTGLPGQFRLVAQLNASSTSVVDTAASGTTILSAEANVLRSRLDASLVIDPGTVVKVDGARIEARMGADLIAEGLPSLPIVFTSLEDQRYGGGGTFDTNDRGDSGELSPGDWGGLYIGPAGSASLDQIVIAGAGGTTRIEGGFASFNAIEVHQGDLRLANSRLENNANGRGVTNPPGERVGRGDNAAATLFVRAAQPVIVANSFISGDSAAISFDVNSLSGREVIDRGRATGTTDSFDVVGNYGPLVQYNRLEDNAINGMQVRGGELATAGVWDDVDIVHVVTDSIEIPNRHIFGGLRLQSDARGSLVVKFQSDEDESAGIVVGGTLLSGSGQFRDIADRIGGALQIVGHPDFPVVLTTLADDTAGAGFTRAGVPGVDTNNDGIAGVDLADQSGGLPTGPEVNNGTTIDNDVDVNTVGHFQATPANGNAIGFAANGFTGSGVTVRDLATAQTLVNQNYIFAYQTYVTTTDGIVSLDTTTITQDATLIADDVVESRGSFPGPNGTVTWIATSSFVDGVARLDTKLELDGGENDLGAIRVISYLDEDIEIQTNDILVTTGVPGEADFRVYTIDGVRRVGFSHGGFYLEDGTNLINATYEGWAADQFNELQTQIEDETQTYSIAGDIDLTDFPSSPDVDFGVQYGPNDVTTAFAWITVETARTATVSSFLELLASDPVLAPVTPIFESGLWDGIVIREGADDRNVAAFTEFEPVRTGFIDLNSIPGQSQFLGEIAPNEQSGDENRRLGFIVSGSVTTRSDLDVYSFIAESGTEVWLDIDRTGNQLDSVVELIDANGRVLAASNDSILAESNPFALYTNVSAGMDPDAAQPLTVVENRLPVQQLTFSESIRDATGGVIALRIAGSDEIVNIDVDVFLSDPATSIVLALQATFPELGSLTGTELRSTNGNNVVVELRFVADDFVGRTVPRIEVSTVGVIGATVISSANELVLDSQLQDEFTTNRKDAGMRIRLPGEAGTRNLYHVRVRSSNTLDPLDFSTLVNPDRVRAGLSRGIYELQIRLSEVDESAGTQVRLADVRYATDGLHIIGQPLHSPLMGEEYEISGDNGPSGTPQPLGYFSAGNDQFLAEAGPLQSDRLAKSIAGRLDSLLDVDLYRFEVRYDNLTRGDNDPPLYLSTVFDLDYAGGFARPDMALQVFRETQILNELGELVPFAELIYTGENSNIADDLPTSTQSDNSEDLSRGSASGTDPYIGAAELIEGTYYLAVTHQGMVPLPMDQFFNPDSANPLFRLEPIDSVTRIAEDRIDSFGGGTAADPTVPILFDDSSLVDYSLDDVLLYVNTGSSLILVNPFTGLNYGTVGNFDDEIEEIAFRSNGELFSYSGFANRQRDDNNWFYYRIDTGDATLSDPLGLDGAGIDTFSASVDEDGEVTIAAGNVGLDVEAMAIGYLFGSESGYFVSNRPLDIGSVQGGADYGTNVLYEFVPENGIANGDPIAFVNRLSGDATDTREVGQINTSPGGLTTSIQLGIQAATVIDGNGQQVPALVDGDTFTLSDFTNDITFEFDSGPTLTALGQSPVLDGESITINGLVFEFETGVRLQLEQAQPSGNLTAGTTVRVTGSDQVATFEFVRTGNPISGNIPIQLLNSVGQPLPAQQVALALSQAINQNVANVGAEAVGDQVVFSGVVAPDLNVTGNGISELGAIGSSIAGATVIDVSEATDPTILVRRLGAAVQSKGIPALVSGTQISFPSLADAQVVLSGNLDGAIELTGFGGVATGNVSIPLFPGDSQSLIAGRISRAVSEAFPVASTISANVAGEDSSSLRINNGEILSVSSANGALVQGGLAPGGLVRGVELVNDQLFAVSDTGGLFRVSSFELQTAGARQIGSYVREATDLVGINFSGLRAGPVSYNDGELRDTLFGLTSNGDIYAFNTFGELQPVFAGGRSMISTGVSGARGLDFSTLGFNLWHTTSQRGEDPGHGINELNNGARQAVLGGTSLAFNFEASAFNSNYPFSERPVILNNDGSVANPRQDEAEIEDRYNLPGGAKGVVQSNPFSLVGYSAADEPMLYFNYFIEADEVSSRDAFRVYVVASDGSQHLVASNSTARGIPVSDEGDEFDDPPQIGQYEDNIDVETQQIFDNTGSWRQARVPLASFAGRDNLSLRIEFSTAGTTATGSLSLRTNSGDQLVDGESFSIGGETFTIDLSPAVGVPSGVQLESLYRDPNAQAVVTIDGQQYVLNDGTRTIAIGQFDVSLLAGLPAGTELADLSALQVANALTEAIRISPPPNNVVSGLSFAEPQDTNPANVGGRNDRTFEAIRLPYESGNTTFIGQGRIGNLGSPSNSDDVDLLQVEVESGTQIAVNLTNTGGTPFTGIVRFFDQDGIELPAAATGSNTATLVAGQTGTVFIGISGQGNNQYDPLFDDGTILGSVGSYDASIVINPLLTVQQNRNLIEIDGAGAVQAAPASLFVVSGNANIAGVPVSVSRFMSSDQIATVVQQVLADRFSAGNVNAFPTHHSSILIPALSIDDVGPFVNETERYGDQFGAGPIAGARDNNFEGVYLDDVIIGFAERGEIATEANPITNELFDEFVVDGRPGFASPADPVSALVTGSYQVEIRDASEYVDSLHATQFRTFDTNQRLTDSYTISAQSASELRDGDSFTISDGRNEVTFEFNLLNALELNERQILERTLAQEALPVRGNGITPGNVEIPFSLKATDPLTGNMRAQTAAEVAANIVKAINRTDVQAVMDVPAVLADGIPERLVSQGGARTASTNPTINLFAEVVVTDHSDSLASIENTLRRGDDNRDRDGQGVILIENSRFLRNSGHGIVISHGLDANVAGQDTPSVVRYPRNLVELNTEKLKPGVVIQSNVLAFNDVGGLQINGIGLTANDTGGDPVAFDRIVNNTIIGGQISAGASAPAEEFEGVLFPSGRISFADAVVSYLPEAGGDPPAAIHQAPSAALGAPDSSGFGPELVDGQSSVSLGLGGSITLQFVDNLLTGSGDNGPDLVVFETGEIESIRVEISRDGLTFVDVGIIGGLSNTVDIDAFGFGLQDRFSIVRLTDLRQGSTGIPSLGADIDAIGAISTSAVERFNPRGFGIELTGNASPTLLNNVLANAEVGVVTDPASNLPILGGNTFYRNSTNISEGVSLGEFAQVIPDAEVLFFGAADLIFVPAAGASIIDSSIDSLEDRFSLTTVKNPLGIPPSPIIAPFLDVNGQLRVDDPDVEPPSGLGERVFKDRGASDRGDLVGPRAVLLSPLAENLGTNAGSVSVTGQTPQAFEVQFIDGLAPADVTPGTGIDDATVSSSSVLLIKDGQVLIEGTDYRFGYNPSTNVIRLTPIAGVWEQDSTYVIRMVDSRDAIIQAVNGNDYNDGDVLRVADSFGATTRFEYETGITLAVTSPVFTAADADGLVVEVFDGTTTIRFELDNDLIFNPTNSRVEIPEIGDFASVLSALAAAVNASGLNLTAKPTEVAIQFLGANPLSTVFSDSTIFRSSGSIGTSIGFGIQVPNDGALASDLIDDGQTFVIRRGAGAEEIFELNTNGVVATIGAIPVNFAASASLDEIANAIVRAVGGTGLGLNPTNVGFGRVFLGGDASYAFDPADSALMPIGNPGQGPTLPIVIELDQTAEQSAQSIDDAIVNEGLAGVSTSVFGSRIFLEGTAGVSGVGAAGTVIVSDEVGNQVQSNQANGRTELTVFVGGGFDYGDAPYASTSGIGAARHAVDTSFALAPVGSLTSVSPDSAAELIDADDDNGVQIIGNLEPGFDSTLVINVTNASGAPFQINAWFDWNDNGLFESSELRTISSAQFGVGAQGQLTTPLSVPANATVGETYARFRLFRPSENPLLGPSGDALSGEVEDYRIIVGNNPFQNSIVIRDSQGNPILDGNGNNVGRADVNNSGFVSAIDALQIINVLRRTGSSEIDLSVAPLPSDLPTFPDPNGDGVISAEDALYVINRLRIIQAEGEAPEESILAGPATNFLPVSSGLLASTATIMGDQRIAENRQELQLLGETLTTVDPPTEKTSVFDSPAVIELDSIVDSLAADQADSGESTSASPLDQIFASL